MRIYAEKLLSLTGWRACQVIDIDTEGGRIISVRTGTEDGCDMYADVITPGLFDVHNHGGCGFDANRPEEKPLRAWLAALTDAGVTDVLLTVSSCAEEEMHASVRFAHEAIEAQKAGDLQGARVAGIHLEGPFLSPLRPGAMLPEYLVEPSVEVYERIVGAYGMDVRLVTLAPERDGAGELIDHLRAQNVRVQAGHTDAGFEQAEEAFARGVGGVCHFFNAARPIHHRTPGVLTAALLNKNIYCEAICDLVHNHAGVLRLIYQNKGPRRMMTVSDSTAPNSLADGTYFAGSHTVIVRDGVQYTPEGRLSGGGALLDKAARNLISIGISPEDAFSMASQTPAEWLGMGDLGRVLPGCRAHLAAFDASYHPVCTVMDGTVRMCGK